MKLEYYNYVGKIWNEFKNMSQTSEKYLSSHCIHKHQFAVGPYLALIIWPRWLFVLETFSNIFTNINW